MVKHRLGEIGRRGFVLSIIGSASVPLLSADSEAENTSERHIFINGTEDNERADFEFTVSGEVREGWSGDADGEINDNSATGTVWGSWEVDYFITGELTSFSSTGDVIVYSVQEGQTPTQLYPRDHHIFIKGLDQKTQYEFTVTGILESGWSNEGDDVTEGKRASGIVWSQKYDDYFYSGEIEDITINGDAEIIIDGKTVDPSSMKGNDTQNFVETFQNQFQLNTDPFYATGTNSFWCSYQYWDKSAIDDTIKELKKLDLNTLRVWGFGNGSSHLFQPEAGKYNEDAFQRLDYLIKKAKENNIRLIIALGNYWSDFGGIDEYVNWSDTASDRTDFYEDDQCQSMYQDYIEYVLTRENTLTGTEFRNEPSIMMWELLNEPRNPAAPDGDGSVLHNWAHDTASYIKKIDSNHLISTGAEGFILGATTEYDEIGWWMNTQGYDFIQLHDSKYIDACSIHLYPDHWRISNEAAIQFMKDRAQDANQVLEKPIYMGEFGKSVIRGEENSEDQMATRNDRYDEWYSVMQRHGFDGVNFWQLVPDQYLNDADQFSVVLPDDQQTGEVIQNGVSKF
ncbi:glycoside hydrolase 5 family protein [Salinigranum salinum]|uniref:glycoside hydrolase 5 family protein n=1 Tax=Salinigranum salinum TaxID=1364937 RepID=UPI00126123ED|nr:cellulase family glycosylhydrolase [Salinigranum salinum]